MKFLKKLKRQWKNRKMFKSITMNLTRRICDCGTEPSIFFYIAADRDIGVRLECQICSIELRIPHSKIRASCCFESDSQKNASVIKIVKDPPDDSDDK